MMVNPAPIISDSSSADQPRVILFSTAVSGGGAENHFARLAEGLFADKSRRWIVSLQKPQGAASSLHGQDVSWLGYRSSKDYPSSILTLRRMIGRTGADLVYSLSRCSNIVNLAATHSLRPRPMTVLGVNDNLEAFDPKRSSPAARFWRHAQRLSYRCADLILTNSPESIGLLEREFKCPPGRTRLIRNPLPVAEIRSRAAMLRQLGSPLPQPYLLSFGRFIEGKGLDLLLDLFAGLRARSLGLRLVLLGDGPMAGALRRKADALGVADEVVFPGWATDPLPWLACAKAYVTPSLREGLSNAVLESMAAEVPVVSFSSTRWIEQFARVGAVAAAPLNDMKAFGAAIELILESPMHSARIVASATRVVADFESALVVREREDLIRLAWKQFKRA
jgi:glycosyltransferase involved in cell wall biosynthesis